MKAGQLPQAPGAGRGGAQTPPDTSRGPAEASPLKLQCRFLQSSFERSPLRQALLRPHLLVRLAEPAEQFVVELLR